MTALVFAAAVLAAAPARADVDVERISFDRSRDGATTVARVHASAPVRAYSVDQDGTTVELVLYRARLARGLQRERAEGAVRAYRVEADEDRVTVRFDLEPGIRVRAYPDRESDDLLLSLSPGATPVARTVPRRPGGGTRGPVFQPDRQPIASRPVEPAGPVPGVTPREAVAATEPASVPTGSPHWRLDTVVLDAGHGAHDYGARANGTSDKEVAFEVVRRLGPMIERELGVRVVYTRTDDSFVELRERGRIANRSGGKLFISVHANAGPSSAHGTETFFLAPRGSKSARAVMERENSVIELESNPELYADFDDEGDILRSLAMSAYQEESQELARLIEGEFRAAGRHSRGVKQNNFIVLWAASMPAVLVEVGFVTNRNEAGYLSSSEGQEETARAIFEAVRAYKERYERGLHTVAGG